MKKNEKGKIVKNLDSDEPICLELPVHNVIIVGDRCCHSNHQRHFWPHFPYLPKKINHFSIIEGNFRKKKLVFKIKYYSW